MKNEGMNNKGRIEYIDVMRGFTMILVVYIYQVVYQHMGDC